MRWRLAIGLACLALAACGGGSSGGLASKPPAQIVLAASAAMHPVEPGAAQGALHFGSWGAPVTLAAPAGATDIRKLAG